MHINVAALWPAVAILVALAVRWRTGRWTPAVIAGLAVLWLPAWLIMLLIH